MYAPEGRVGTVTDVLYGASPSLPQALLVSSGLFRKHTTVACAETVDEVSPSLRRLTLSEFTPDPDANRALASPPGPGRTSLLHRDPVPSGSMNDTDGQPGDTDGQPGDTDGQPGDTDGQPGDTDGQPGRSRERFELVLAASVAPDALPACARVHTTRPDGSVVVVADVDENEQVYELLSLMGELGITIVSLTPAGA